MNAISKIVEFLNSITTTFYNLYLETRGWIYPFSLVANLFYTLSSIFNSIAWQFYYFNQWVETVTNKIASILSYENIASYFEFFLNSASEALAWVRNALKNVTSIIETWWQNTQLTVRSWIDTAKQTLQSNINTINKSLNTLLETWNELKDKLPTASEIWAGVNSLITTAFTDREKFWEGWQEMKTNVVEFFTDPGQWFMDRIEGWLERFW